MVGTLNKTQIEHVLRHQVVGRMGCYAEGKMYIVPVTYVFDGDYIYVHSKEGQKVQMIRNNPNVCFQVDVIDNLTNWRSVIIWGQYEELDGIKKQQEALNILNDRLGPITLSATVRPVQTHDQPVVSKGLKAVAYRIKVSEFTGRFEKSG